MLIDDLAPRLIQADREFYAGAAEAFSAITGQADCFLAVGETQALFAGQDSPLTQASGAFSASEMDQLQLFFRGRADWYEAIVTPYDGDEAAQRLIGCGASAMGWEDVLWRQPCHAEGRCDVREIGHEELAAWEAIGSKAFWGEDPPPFAVQLGKLLMRIPNTRRYLAYVDGEPAASASMSIRSGVAFLGGGATLPRFRGQGLQTALIQQRLNEAVGIADIAVLGAKPGSASHRNAERAGFRVGWSQLSLRVPVPRL